MQERTQNFAICKSDFTKSYVAYEIPLYEDDYLLHPDFTMVPTHLTSYSFATEVTVYYTASNTTLEESSSRSCPDSCTNSPARLRCPNTPAVIKTPLLTHPFPHPTSTNSRAVGRLETSWTLRTGSTPPPFSRTDSRRRPTQAVYIDPEKLDLTWMQDTMSMDSVYEDYMPRQMRDSPPPARYHGLPAPVPPPASAPTYDWHRPSSTPATAADLSLAPAEMEMQTRPTVILPTPRPLLTSLFSLKPANNLNAPSSNYSTSAGSSSSDLSTGTSTQGNRPRPPTPDNIVTVETDTSDADSAQPTAQIPLPLLPPPRVNHSLHSFRERRRAAEQGLRPPLLDSNRPRPSLVMDSAGYMVDPSLPVSGQANSREEPQRASRPRPKKFAHRPRRS